MIIRLTQKLGDKLGVKLRQSLPRDPNPFADWTAHLFTAQRTQYILLANTASLYSVVLFGRGLTHEGVFLSRALPERNTSPWLVMATSEPSARRSNP